ncbi:MAG: macro domain-containing protein [Proteobacteria bacterium]|nr:macro domain-containing protein [Pseudomonadota bacterium]
MIKLTQGNMLEADVEALVNTVNCVGVMGKGIALQFKQAFRDNFQAYANACRKGEVKPGLMFIFPTDRMINPKYIINFPTKRHWKEKSKLEYIEQGLNALVKEVGRLGIKAIAIPPLGCGYGGLNWPVVCNLIETAFDQLPDVQVLLFEPRGTPEAESMPIDPKKPSLTRARALLIKLLEQYAIPGYRLSLLEIQKLAYFLQVAGEPLRLKYGKQKYGPYAENLHFVLQRLEGHYLRGYGDRSVKASIRLLASGTEEVDEFLADDPEAYHRLERVKKLIEGFETPYGMELLSSVHWVASADDEPAQTVDQAVERIFAWNAHKRKTFKASHIYKAWSHLAEQHWLPSPGSKN